MSSVPDRKIVAVNLVPGARQVEDLVNFGPNVL